MLDLAAAHAERWSQTDELLAVNVEVTHSLLRAVLALWGDKNTSIPDPLRIARPGDAPPESKAVRFGDLVRQMAGK